MPQQLKRHAVVIAVYITLISAASSLPSNKKSHFQNVSNPDEYVSLASLRMYNPSDIYERVKTGNLEQDSNDRFKIYSQNVSNQDELIFPESHRMYNPAEIYDHVKTGNLEQDSKDQFWRSNPDKRSNRDSIALDGTPLGVSNANSHHSLRSQGDDLETDHDHDDLWTKRSDLKDNHRNDFDLKSKLSKKLKVAFNEAIQQMSILPDKRRPTRSPLQNVRL